MYDLLCSNVEKFSNVISDHIDFLKKQVNGDEPFSLIDYYWKGPIIHTNLFSSLDNSRWYELSNFRRFLNRKQKSDPKKLRRLIVPISELKELAVKFDHEVEGYILRCNINLDLYRSLVSKLSDFPRYGTDSSDQDKEIFDQMSLSMPIKEQILFYIERIREAAFNIGDSNTVDAHNIHYWENSVNQIVDSIDDWHLKNGRVDNNFCKQVYIHLREMRRVYSLLRQERANHIGRLVKYRDSADTCLKSIKGEPNRMAIYS